MVNNENDILTFKFDLSNQTKELNIYFDVKQLDFNNVIFKFTNINSDKSVVFYFYNSITFLNIIIEGFKYLGNFTIINYGIMTITDINKSHINKANGDEIIDKTNNYFFKIDNRGDLTMNGTIANIESLFNYGIIGSSICNLYVYDRLENKAGKIESLTLENTYIQNIINSSSANLTIYDNVYIVNISNSWQLNIDGNQTLYVESITNKGMIVNNYKIEILFEIENYGIFENKNLIKINKNSKLNQYKNGIIKNTSINSLLINEGVVYNNDNSFLIFEQNIYFKNDGIFVHNSDHYNIFNSSLITKENYFSNNKVFDKYIYINQPFIKSITQKYKIDVYKNDKIEYDLLDNENNYCTILINDIVFDFKIDYIFDEYKSIIFLPYYENKNGKENTEKKSFNILC